MNTESESRTLRDATAAAMAAYAELARDAPNSLAARLKPEFVNAVIRKLAAGAKNYPTTATVLAYLKSHFHNKPEQFSPA